MNTVKLQDIKLIHRNHLHSYIVTIKKAERKIKEAIPFKTAIIRIKYLGINLSKETKDLYIEDIDEKIKDNTNRWRNMPCSWIVRINIVKVFRKTGQGP